MFVKVQSKKVLKCKVEFAMHTKRRQYLFLLTQVDNVFHDVVVWGEIIIISC